MAHLDATTRVMCMLPHEQALRRVPPSLRPFLSEPRNTSSKGTAGPAELALGWEGTSWGSVVFGCVCRAFVASLDRGDGTLNLCFARKDAALDSALHHLYRTLQGRVFDLRECSHRTHDTCAGRASQRSRFGTAAAISNREEVGTHMRAHLAVPARSRTSPARPRASA